jgi:hypothetical protein
MKTLRRSMDGMLRRVQKLVVLPWRADRLWGGVDRAAFHRLGAPWAGLACTVVDRVEEETVTPVFHSTQISGGVDRAEFLDRGGEATSIFHREIVHEGEAEEDTATREWIAPIYAPRRRSAPQHGRGPRVWVGDWIAPMESKWVGEWNTPIYALNRRSASCRGGELDRADLRVEEEICAAPRWRTGSRRDTGGDCADGWGSGPRHESGVGRDTRRRAWWRAASGAGLVGARARGRDTRRRWLAGARINRSGAIIPWSRCGAGWLAIEGSRRERERDSRMERGGRRRERAGDGRTGCGRLRYTHKSSRDINYIYVYTFFVK